MQNDEEIEIAIEGASETPKDDIKVVAEEPAAKLESPDVDSSIEELRKQIEDERRARLAAENKIAHLTAIAGQAQEEVNKSHYQIVTNAIESAKRDTELLKTEYAMALERGDYAKASDIQIAISQHANRLSNLETGKIAMEEKQQQQKVPVQPTTYSDPVEQMASGMSEKSAAWLRAHPEYARNPVLTQQMVAAHNFVIANGYSADTPEYFGRIEKLLEISSEAPETSSGASEAPVRRPSPAAAPVSRSGTGNGTRPNVVRLSSDEREMAQMMGMSPEEYARNKLALKREGKLH
ncbi:hypothetical protein EBT25_13390 [bacterium]|nr:hypothetical protein [bacterium]